MKRLEAIKNSQNRIEALRVPLTSVGVDLMNEENNLIFMLRLGAKKIFCVDSGYTFNQYEDVSNLTDEEIEDMIKDYRQCQMTSWKMEIED